MDASEEGVRQAFVVVQEVSAGSAVPARVLPLSSKEALALDGFGRPVPREGAITLRWNGVQATLETCGEEVRVAGKRVEPPCVVKPGDELQLSHAHVVLGVTVPLSAGGRRALTHHEFRERLYEECARASRDGRPTAVVMVAARPSEGRHITAGALESFRGGDLVGTYASDEPEFLLPDTEEGMARLVVSRLLESLNLQAAVGIAVAPHHGATPERLLHAARRALEHAVRHGHAVSDPPPKARSGSSAEPVAYDPASVALIAEVHAAAARPDPALLVGEGSVGKSVFARLLHTSGERTGRFVIRHGATFEVRMELDACLAEAAGGSLFLEEIAELSLADQRVLAQRWDQIEAADVRMVASTERALSALVERGAFDRALFGKFGGQAIEVPSLRSRPEDIVPMAERFARAASDRESVFSAGAIARLRSYPWPGNVLELRNAVERAVRLAGDGTVLAEHLPSEPMPIAAGDGRLREHVDSVERDAIVRALADSNDNQTHAAKRLGVSRRALIYKMEKYGLKRAPRSAKRA